MAAEPLIDEQATFRAEVVAFLEAHAEPAGDADPWALNFHTDEEDARRQFDEGRTWQRLLFDANLAGLTFPEEYGGRGGSAWHAQIFREEAARYRVPPSFIGSTISMLAPALLAHGTEEQKRELLPRLLSAEDAWCQLFSEPGAGSDLATLACRAVRDGDTFVVTGQKVWNSAAQFCDRGMLLARTNPDVPKHAGITFLLVDMHSPGVEVRPLVQATGAAHFNEVFLSEVTVPVVDVLGEIDGGWAPARTVMANESASIGGGGGGTNAKLVTLARRYGSAGDPGIRQALADHYCHERTLEMMGARIRVAAQRREALPLDPSILKLAVAVNRVRSGNLAVAIGGADVLAGDAPHAQWVQAELLGRYSISIGGGTNEVQRNNLAERALGLPREPRADKDVPWREILRS